MRKFRLIAAISLAFILMMSLLPGCNGETTPTTEPTTPTGEWQWPDITYVCSSGSSGMAKYVSWISLMQEDIPAKLRVIPEANGLHRYRDIKEGKMFIAAAGKSAFRNIIEALDENAVRDVGPFPARVVWVHALSNSGVYVRGDSQIQTIYDIPPGTRWAIWDDSTSVKKVPLAILRWAQIDENDIIWVNTGSYDACQRAVADGNADITWGFPTSPSVFEAAAAPHKIRYLELNSEEDPEGAIRFREQAPLYVFGPIGNGVPEARGVWGTQGFNMEITSAGTDPELVYRFAKWLDENFDRYKDAFDSNKWMDIDNLMEAIGQTYIPCHDGLIKYLKEKGRWTEDNDARQAENVDLFDQYIKAYAEAIALADAKGIETVPTNDAWQKLWTDYKVEIGIRPIRMFTNLTGGRMFETPTSE
jgi:NMT1 family protein